MCVCVSVCVWGGEGGRLCKLNLQPYSGTAVDDTDQAGVDGVMFTSHHGVVIRGQWPVTTIGHSVTKAIGKGGGRRVAGGGGGWRECEGLPSQFCSPRSEKLKDRVSFDRSVPELR